jgi:hypothetical protein
MKKIILICCGVLLANCSTGPRTSLNCEKLHLDSEARLQELRHIFASYQGVNYDLAMKLAGPLREEVGDLDARVRKQKQKCWSSEKRPIDAEMALLKEELFKVYGKDDEEKQQAVKSQSVAQQKASPRKPASTDSIADSVELDSE